MFKDIITRHPANPILTADDIPGGASSVFNSALVRHEGRIVALLRVEKRDGTQSIRYGESADGLRFDITDEVLLSPTAEPFLTYQEAIYDVTDSPKWEEGRHFGRHRAGADLTQALDGAPHGAEVLEKVRKAGEIASHPAHPSETTPTLKAFTVMAYGNLVIIFLILACISVWRWDFPLRLLPEGRAEVLAGEGCMECHQAETPGLAHDWAQSVHAKVGVGCYTCHQTGRGPCVALLIVSQHAADGDCPVRRVPGFRVLDVVVSRL